LDGSPAFTAKTDQPGHENGTRDFSSGSQLSRWYDRFRLRRRADARIVAWQSLRLIYVRVPKCANTAIAAAFPGGRVARVPARRLADDLADWLKFSFVRNPYARLVSTYCDKIHPASSTPGKLIDGVHHRFVSMGLPVYAGMPFEEFVEVVCELDDASTEKHLKSQSWHLYRDGRCIVDEIGRVESIGQHWPRLAERVGRPPRLRHLNPSRRRHLACYYSSATVRRRVADRYRMDFENFGYRTDRFD
jgi:hypothetical protein